MPLQFAAPGLVAGALALSGGGTGLLSVPDAGLLAPDTVEFQHSNGILPVEGPRGAAANPIFRRAQTSDRALNDHIQFAVLPRTEFGVRLSSWYEEGTGERQLNDLSGHVKWQAWNGARLRVAIGARDFAGEAEAYAPAQFAVADLRGDWWQLVAGFGRSDVNNTALDGPFGGLRVAPRRWLDLMVDHDGVATNFGARLHAQAGRFGAYVQAHGSSYEEQDFVWAAGLRYRIGDDSRRVPRDLEPRAAQPRVVGEPLAVEFLQFRGGADALAERVGAQAQADSRCVPLLARAQQVPLLRAQCGEQPVNLRWQTSWSALAGGAEAWRPLHLRIEPSARYAIGTEYGRADYAWAVRGSLEYHTPLGLGGYAAWDIPAGNSDEYGEGGVFFRSRYESGSFEQALQFTWHALPGTFVQASAGRSTLQARDLDFRRAEVASMLFGGRLALSYSHTSLDTELPRVTDSQSLFRAFAWLAAPGYALEYTRGEHLFGDTGQRVELFRYIGRTRLGIYLKDGEEQRALGMTVSVPLTPARAWGNRWLRASGTAHFAPNLETQIDTGSRGNNLRPNFLQSFTPQRSLIEDVLDQWRYSPHYISRR